MFLFVSRLKKSEACHPTAIFNLKRNTKLWFFSQRVLTNGEGPQGSWKHLGGWKSGVLTWLFLCNRYTYFSVTHKTANTKNLPLILTLLSMLEDWKTPRLLFSLKPCSEKSSWCTQNVQESGIKMKLFVNVFQIRELFQERNNVV